MKSKHLVKLTNARPLSLKWQHKLDADPRVTGYFTEQVTGPRDRLIWVQLADGYNYEGRGSICGVDMADLADRYKRIDCAIATE